MERFYTNMHIFYTAVNLNFTGGNCHLVYRGHSYSVMTKGGARRLAYLEQNHHAVTFKNSRRNAPLF